MSTRRSPLAWILGALGVLAILGVLAVVFEGDNLRALLTTPSVDYAADALPCSRNPATRQAWVKAGLEAARAAFPGVGVAVRGQGCGWDGGARPRHVYLTLGPLVPPQGHVALYVEATASLVGVLPRPLATLTPWRRAGPAMTFATRLAARPELAPLFRDGAVACVSMPQDRMVHLACRPRRRVTPAWLRSTPGYRAGRCGPRESDACVDLELPRAPAAAGRPGAGSAR